MPVPTPPSAGRALVREIQNHETDGAVWAQGAIRKRMDGDEYGALINDGHADMHRDLAEIKRVALAKLNAYQRQPDEPAPQGPMEPGTFGDGHQPDPYLGETIVLDQEARDRTRYG